MIAKLFNLEESDVGNIQKIKLELGFHSEAEVIRYLIRQYVANEKKETGTQLAILRSIEEKAALLLDVANSDLIKRNDKVCYPVSMVESPVITKAREIRKKDLANKKQKKDYRNRKKGN